MRSAGVVLAVMILAVGVSVVLAQETSENSDRVRQYFERFPAADANGDGLLTLEEAQAHRQQQAEAQQRRQEYEAGRPAPDFPDLAYGPHERNVLDLWLAEAPEGAEGPRPLAAFIHGGGWRAGDKSSISRRTLEALLAAGISVAAINYRLTDSAPFPAPMTDAGRALQFLRLHAAEYSLDPTRIGTWGGSAGAATSMWLAFHDDLADPESEDPVLRESTRLTCIAPQSGPTTLEIDVSQEWLGASITLHPALMPMFGVADVADFDDPQVRALMAEASPINHLTADDTVPVYATYGQPNTQLGEDATANEVAHHPRYGVHLKEKMDALGLECVLIYPEYNSGDPYGGMVEFFKAKLLGGQ